MLGESDGEPIMRRSRESERMNRIDLEAALLRPAPFETRSAERHSQPGVVRAIETATQVARDIFSEAL